jgi:hypothetical protein
MIILPGIYRAQQPWDIDLTITELDLRPDNPRVGYYFGEPGPWSGSRAGYSIMLDHISPMEGKYWYDSSTRHALPL